MKKFAIAFLALASLGVTFAAPAPEDKPAAGQTDSSTTPKKHKGKKHHGKSKPETEKKANPTQ